MSKSLPCVFRNEVAKNEFFIDLKAANTRQEIDEVLSMNFKASLAGLRKINFDQLVTVSKIHREFSKSGELVK